MILKYRWIFGEEPNDVAVQNLIINKKIPKTLAQVLVSRGVNNSDEAEEFFNPTLESLYDPYLMNGMDKAVDRILLAIEKKEIIWIHGDYDVDGTASAAMALLFFREIGAECYYYVPDRFHEGYGFSIVSVKAAIEKKASLIVTVDCGITSFEPLDYAAEHNIDCVICDHHEPAERIPDVVAILDPIKPNCNYPFKHLAACGVVFKLVQALAAKIGKPESAFKYLDFVAIASAADMVPLTDENRIMAHYGLTLLNSQPRPGLKGLIECTGIKIGSVTASSIVFGLAPRINAAGRLGDPRRAVEMMIEDNEFNAFRIAQDLEQENRRRRALDEKIFEHAQIIAEKQLAEGNRKSLVIHHGDWHPGVIGIVASRLVDKFHLPTVLLTTIDNLAKGSARSVNNFDVHNALKQCAPILVEFGGHKHAAGLSIEVENLPEFGKIFNDLARIHISDDKMTPEILIDAELLLNDLSPIFFEVLNQFAPFGYENAKPNFYSHGVKAIGEVKIVGGHHLKFRAMQGNFIIDAIGINLAHKIDTCRNGKTFSIVYNLEFSTYTKQSTPQLRIKDILSDDEADNLRGNS